MFDLTLNEESLAVNLDLVSFVTKAGFGRPPAKSGLPDGITQRSGRGVSRRATSSGECVAMREKIKKNSHPTGRGLSESERSHKGELIT